MGTELTRQNDVSTGRDNSGRDIIYNNSNNQNQYIINADDASSPVAAWMILLAEEISSDKQVIAFIDTLQMYTERHSHDGIDGLENKLQHAGRSSEISLALRKKELFTRLLARYSMFDSAQQIFSYLLARMEGDFRAYVLPSLSKPDDLNIDQIINEFLVTPCANEIKSGIFCLNPAIAAGMVYWLAEQCYIRWHA